MDTMVTDVLTRAAATMRGRRVFVTGSTGFKGSWLCTWLASMGAEVTGFALPPADDAPLFDILRLNDRIKQVNGDIRDINAITDAMNRAAPEVVIHLAAQALVGRGYEFPKLTFDTNVGGGVNLLEAARGVHDLRALVFITSDKCYRNNEWDWGYRENDALGGTDPYSASKAAAEHVFETYNISYFQALGRTQAASARAGNVIGGGDHSVNRIIPDCIRALAANRTIEIRNALATRPWQHVLEPLSGYLVLAAKLLSNQPHTDGHNWNFGPNVENIRTVHEVAEKAAECWGSGTVRLVPQKDAPHESTLLTLSSDKAKSKLGWHPRWDFNEAMERTVGWYKKVSEKTDPVALTEQQIADYMASHAV